MRSIGKRLSGALASLVLALSLLGGGVTTAAAAPLAADLDSDGHVTDADAVYLLMHTFFPADYPIGSGLTPVDQSPGEEFELPDD